MLAVRACVSPPLTLYATPPWLLHHTTGLCHGATQPAVQGSTAGDAVAGPFQVRLVPVTHFLRALPDTDTQRGGPDGTLEHFQDPTVLGTIHSHFWNANFSRQRSTATATISATRVGRKQDRKFAPRTCFSATCFHAAQSRVFSRLLKDTLLVLHISLEQLLLPLVSQVKWRSNIPGLRCDQHVDVDQLHLPAPPTTPSHVPTHCAQGSVLSLTATVEHTPPAHPHLPRTLLLSQRLHQEHYLCWAQSNT